MYRSTTHFPAKHSLHIGKFASTFLSKLNVNVRKTIDSKKGGCLSLIFFIIFYRPVLLPKKQNDPDCRAMA